MKWDSSDKLDSHIVDSGRWFKLSSAQENAPVRSGVYVFANSELQVKYVGKAGASRLRAEIQNALYREKGRGASQFAWFATNSDDKAWSLESDLIAKYQPSNNDKK